jgi:uncharacterized protein YggT (Ycf19 family)
MLTDLTFMLISALDLAMFLRAIMSWIDPMGESGFRNFLVALTEPVILPFRVLCAKMHWFEGTPLDVPFLMTVLVLMILQSILTLL